MQRNPMLPKSTVSHLTQFALRLQAHVRAWLWTGVMAIGLSFTLAGLSRADTPLPAARDLQSSAAQAASRHQPLVVMFSLPGCTYCERLRKSTYQWLVKDGYMVQQVEMEPDNRLLGFDGKPTTGKALAQKYGVQLAPTVLFLGPGGREVADRLVGAGQPDFYQAFVDRALKEGAARLGAHQEAPGRSQASWAPVGGGRSKASA
ncbi:MAG: thioredoxin fold domain-containing protein [Burkholderiales bacterium]|jgi:thiol-disulfide isomerase/thioredoxin|nr:thioredoxin fold domain-containing protein [Burkholderiales bacterium]